MLVATGLASAAVERRKASALDRKSARPPKLAERRRNTQAGCAFRRSAPLAFSEGTFEETRKKENCGGRRENFAHTIAQRLERAN